MGYTHYWSSTSAFSDQAWNDFIKETRSIFDTTKIPLPNSHGEKNTNPEITDIDIAFNGVEDDSHESCVISKSPVEFEFCKTARKPYDFIVVQILKLARKYNPSFDLRSDGGNKVFDD